MNKPCNSISALAAQNTELESAIRVAQQLLDSDSIVSMREALRLLLRALDADGVSTAYATPGGGQQAAPSSTSEGWTATMAVRLPGDAERLPGTGKLPDATVVADLPPAVSDLLAAVVEALTVPLPSTDGADEKAYHRLLERRTADVRIILGSIVDYPDVPIDNDPDDIRARTAETPVTYALYESAADGGQQ